MHNLALNMLCGHVHFVDFLCICRMLATTSQLKRTTLLGRFKSSSSSQAALVKQLESSLARQQIRGMLPRSFRCWVISCSWVPCVVNFAGNKIGSITFGQWIAAYCYHPESGPTPENISTGIGWSLFARTPSLWWHMDILLIIFIYHLSHHMPSCGVFLYWWNICLCVRISYKYYAHEEPTPKRIFNYKQILFDYTSIVAVSDFYCSLVFPHRIQQDKQTIWFGKCTVAMLANWRELIYVKPNGNSHPLNSLLR